MTAPREDTTPDSGISRPLRFVRRGEVVTLGNVPPTRTLLEVLREDLACTGTKEGCGEGDCGACTVVLGEVDEEEHGKIRYRAINSCIRLAHSIDGMALWTVEDIAPTLVASRTALLPEGAQRLRPGEAGSAALAGHRKAVEPTLHPAQEAMVRAHGSQCGFCTPGFVMSMFGMYQNHIAPTLATSCAALPPEGAAAPADWQSQIRGPGLADIPGSATGSAQGAGTPKNPITRELAQHDLSGNLCRCTGYRPILEAAQAMAQLPAVRVDEAGVLQKLKHAVRPAPGLQPDSPSAAYLSPRTLPALLQARARHPQAQLVAGCTDVGLWVTKMHMQFAQVLDVTRVAELRRVEDYPHHIAIGAAVTLADAYAALVAGRPQLHNFAARFAGLPVRNSGTLGGNVANGSPIGDSMPLLISLRASVVLMSVRGHRELPLEHLYTGYRKNVMAPDEVLAWIKVPKPVAGERAEVYKVSKRYDDDISAVCLAIRLRIEGGVVVSASLGAGGVAATPVRAAATEAALVGQPWSQATVTRAMATLRAEFSPLSDMRASAAYRRQVLGNLLQRFWLESQGMQQINLATARLEALA